MSRLSLTTLALLLSLSTVAQVAVRDMRGLTREQIDSIVRPKVSPQGAEQLVAEHDTYDLGNLSEDDEPVSHTFTLRNVSGKSVSIQRVRTTCGCTSAAFDSTAIAPGATTKVTLTYDPEDRPGTIDVNAYVYLADGSKQPTARLSLYGEVHDSDVWSHLPQTMSTLRVKRKEVTISELPATGKPSVRIACANSGERPLRLKASMLPAYATFRTEPEVIAPGTEADIIVTIDVAKLPKRGDTLRFPMLIEGIAGRPSERTIYITIKEIRR